MQVSHHQGAGPTFTQDEHMQVSYHQGAGPTFTQDAHMQVSHHEGVDYHFYYCLYYVAGQFLCHLMVETSFLLCKLYNIPIVSRNLYSSSL
jgi:hypothetical protein